MNEIICNAVTCLRPTDGGLHFGHYIGNIQPLIAHQSIYNCFFIFADLQTVDIFGNELSKKLLLSNIYDMMKQILSLGVDENIVYFARESKIKNCRFNEFSRLSQFLTTNRINRLPAIKNEKDSIKMAKYLFPIFQILDFIITDSTYAFSNMDNKPIVELANEVFNKCNKQCKTNYKHVSLIHGPVESLIGTDGYKMSKNKNNCIFLNDSRDEIIKKVNKLYTDPNRIHSNINGNIKNNNAFKYLEAFFDKDSYEKIRALYEQGEIGDAKIKDIISKKLILIANNSKDITYTTNRLDKILEKGEKFLNNR